MSAAASPVHVGTSGYSFADWVGPFYPPGTKSADFLRHYATQFSCVEVNATYYRLPPPRTLDAMQKKTPDGFRFVVKLHQSMTHERATGEALYREFLGVIQPLKDAGKYDGLLAQFPWGFRRDDAAKAHLEFLRGALPGEPLWVEFRHASWVHKALPGWLAERQLGYCDVDEPALPGLVPPLGHVTNGSAYVRFHGRNEQTWWGRGGGDRYDYDYSERQLTEWVERVRKLSEQAKQTYLFFNNCHAGQAARNAKLMEELLRRQQSP
ncbi:MAG: DUF72 domain-containing protein [Candidatus Eisenbacteria bacterium]